MHACPVTHASCPAGLLSSLHTHLLPSPCCPNKYALVLAKSCRQKVV